tara:strand:+ start:2439 stop:2717 length:279 start_codon:yes stop_codon:yes gene_type:complete
MGFGTTNLGAGFASQEARYLEPPEEMHYDVCEAMRWYWCKECDHPFMEDSDLSGTKKVVNLHDCGQGFNKRYDECICEFLGKDYLEEGLHYG